MKICTRCGINKLNIDFAYQRNQCKKCRYEDSKERYFKICRECKSPKNNSNNLCTECDKYKKDTWRLLSALKEKLEKKEITKTEFNKQKKSIISKRGNKTKREINRFLDHIKDNRYWADMVDILKIAYYYDMLPENKERLIVSGSLEKQINKMFLSLIKYSRC